MKDFTNSRILIVDDEKDLCILLKNAILKTVIANIDICHSVKDAYMKISTTPYSIVYYDYSLPDGTGADLVNYTIENAEKKPYIVGMSAYTAQHEIQNLYDLGIDLFISKPLSKQKIQKSLDQISEQ